jgi:hypothetical protein
MSACRAEKLDIEMGVVGIMLAVGVVSVGKGFGVSIL